MNYHRFIGTTVDMIYIDNKGKVTRRKAVILAADERVVRGYCLLRMAPRIFHTANILAIRKVAPRRHAN